MLETRTWISDADLSHATESKDVMFEAAALSHVSPTLQHVVQSKRAVECAQAIVFIRHESRYLIVPDSKVHHGVSEGCKDAEGSLTAWVRECSLNQRIGGRNRVKATHKASTFEV